MQSTAGISFSSSFDSGNGKLISMREEGDCTVLDMEIEPDVYCGKEGKAHLQWFHFREYQACASYVPGAPETWFRVPETTYDGGVLSIRHTPLHDLVSYAYFAPYTQERHSALIAKVQVWENVTVSSIGQSIQGREIDLVQIGQDGPKKKKVWLIARQHPGQTQAEWFIEGLIEALADPRADHAVASRLLRDCVFFAVPNINPDGSFLGHLRCNAVGANLNRWWAGPTVEDSPEVYHTLAKIKQTGCSLLIDAHGDEEIPYTFVAGLDGIPKFGTRLKALQDSFTKSWMVYSTDFQVTYGYGLDPPGKANLTLCSKQIGETFDILSLTLEMPFKDCASNPDQVRGFSPQRCKALGASILAAILDVLPDL